MLDTDAVKKASSTTSEALSALKHNDRDRRVAAVERARRTILEFERLVEEVVAGAGALTARLKSETGEAALGDLDQWIGSLEGTERVAAASLHARRAAHKLVLAFLSERDRALFDDARLLVERDREAATRLCETLRDLRWALMAVRAERSPKEEAVEISSAADLRRALVGR